MAGRLFETAPPAPPVDPRRGWTVQQWGQWVAHTILDLSRDADCVAALDRLVVERGVGSALELLTELGHGQQAGALREGLDAIRARLARSSWPGGAPGPRSRRS